MTEERIEGRLLYRDNRVTIRLDTAETEGCILYIAGQKAPVFLPRGTLQHIATTDENKALAALETVIRGHRLVRIGEDGGIDSYELRNILKEVYAAEEKRINEGGESIRRQFK